MSDVDDIARLIHLHGHVIDGKHWDRLGEVFAEDGSFEIEGTSVSMSGLENIVSFMSSVTQPLAHFSTNVLVHVEDGSNEATAQVKIFAPRADGTSAIGTYHDDIVRTPEGWRFRKRRVVVAELHWRAASSNEAAS